jgi:hypothetical protein
LHPLFFAIVVLAGTNAYAHWPQNLLVTGDEHASVGLWTLDGIHIGNFGQVRPRTRTSYVALLRRTRHPRIESNGMDGIRTAPS